MQHNVIHFDQEDHALSTGNQKFDPNNSVLSAGVSLISEVSIINDDPNTTSLIVPSPQNSKKKPKKNFLLINKSMTNLRRTSHLSRDKDSKSSYRGSDKKTNHI